MFTQVSINNIFQHTIVNIFLPIIFNICFVCSKETSQLDGSFEYPQHMSSLRNMKIYFLVTKAWFTKSSSLQLGVNLIQRDLSDISLSLFNDRYDCVSQSWISGILRCICFIFSWKHMFCVLIWSVLMWNFQWKLIKTLSQRYKIIIIIFVWKKTCLI